MKLLNFFLIGTFFFTVICFVKGNDKDLSILFVWGVYNQNPDETFSVKGFWFHK